MITVADLKGATREQVGDLERRFGRKRVYVIGGIIALFVVILTFRAFIGPSKPAEPPARLVTVARVVQKDVPLYLDEIGTCAAYETVQVQAQVNGQIIARRFSGRLRCEERRPAFHD